MVDDLERGHSYARATIPFAITEGHKLHEAFLKAGFAFEGSHDNKSKVESESDSATSNGESDGEEEVGKTLEFLRRMGKAKHEPCGERWSSSFGDSAWRMAVMAICLSPR